MVYTLLRTSSIARHVASTSFKYPQGATTRLSSSRFSPFQSEIKTRITSPTGSQLCRTPARQHSSGRLWLPTKSIQVDFMLWYRRIIRAGTNSLLDRIWPHQFNRQIGGDNDGENNDSPTPSKTDHPSYPKPVGTGLFTYYQRLWKEKATSSILPIVQQFVSLLFMDAVKQIHIEEQDGNVPCKKKGAKRSLSALERYMDMEERYKILSPRAKAPLRILGKILHVTALFFPSTFDKTNHPSVHALSDRMVVSMIERVLCDKTFLEGLLTSIQTDDGKNPGGNIISKTLLDRQTTEIFRNKKESVTRPDFLGKLLTVSRNKKGYLEENSYILFLGKVNSRYTNQGSDRALQRLLDKTKEHIEKTIVHIPSHCFVNDDSIIPVFRGVGSMIQFGLAKQNGEVNFELNPICCLAGGDHAFIMYQVVCMILLIIDQNYRRILSPNFVRSMKH